MNQGYTYRETLAPSVAGRALLDFLAENWRHGDRAAWNERLARDEVVLDGVVARGAETLVSGKQIEWRRPPWVEPVVPLALALLYRDDSFLAVAKPAGLPTMPSGGRFLAHTLLHQLRRRHPEAGLLHRLDRGTSGVVLVARTAEARRAGSELFRTGRIERRYRGRVVGALAQGRLVLDAPIGEVPHPTIGRAFAATADGRRAVTHVETLDRDDATDTTLVAIRIESGRPHQIRIHLAWAGVPLVGEPFFARGGVPRSDGATRPGDPGYLLHAESLRFEHPFTHRPVEVWCAPPPSLRRPGEIIG